MLAYCITLNDFKCPIYINFLPLSHHFTVLMLQTSNGLLQTCRDVSFFCARPMGRSEGRPFPGLGSRPILSLFLFESRLSMSSRTWRWSQSTYGGQKPGSLTPKSSVNGCSFSEIAYYWSFNPPPYGNGLRIYIGSCTSTSLCSKSVQRDWWLQPVQS